MKNQEITNVLDYFKNHTDNPFDYAQAEALLEGLIEQGYTIEQFKKVTLAKIAQWQNTKFKQYIRPQTLFGENFTKYLNEQTRNTERLSKLAKSAEQAKRANWRLGTHRR
jgi:uncharacterized phage protein (TIGR02220 family)